MKTSFKTHAYLTTSNFGGIEIEISDCGDAVRCRDNYGQDKLRSSSWKEIEIDEDGVGSFKFKNSTYKLNEFMRV